MSTQQEKEDAFKAKKIGTVLNALMQIRLLMVQFGILEWGGCGDCGSPWVNFSKESNLSVTDVNISKTPQKMRADESFLYLLRFNIWNGETVYVNEKGEYKLGVE